MTTPTPRLCHILRFAAIAALGGLPALRAAADAPPDGPQKSPAEQVVRLNEYEVTADNVSALTSAPVEGKLDAVQPQSSISAQTINNTIAPTADYATIAGIAPSVANVETEGPGLSESKLLTMRGFSDGNYNVTYDGIPFGDANGPSHHTTSYFPAKVLGGVVIDRGPGTADTMGEATYGGTMALLSKDPRPDRATVLTVSDGSWNTFLGNLEVNTGELSKLNNASLVATYQYMSTDGYRTFSYMNRNTYYLKYVQPIGRNTVLTVVGNYNNIKFNNPGTVTQAQINAYGRNYGLDFNPFDPNNNYYPYNFQTKQADMEYVGIDSLLGSNIRVSDKAYTYAYNNDSHESSVDPVAGAAVTKFPGTAYAGPGYVNTAPNTLPGSGEGQAAGTGITNDNDPGGQWKVNAYRAFGNDLVVSYENDALTAKAGAWTEYIRCVRYNYFLDYSPAYAAANPGYILPGGLIDLKNSGGSPYQPGYAWFMHVYNKTFQPFAQLEWHPIPNLTITLGVKYSSFTIDTEALVNQTKALAPLFYNATYIQPAPNFEINYRLNSQWSLYAQIARGMLFPNVTEAEVTPNDPKDTVQSYNPASLKEQTTVNYQAGTVFKTERFNADADVYLININNYVSSVTDPADSTNTLYFNSMGAWYSGLEAEATYYLGGGVSAYANGSLNRAVYKTLSGVPGFNVASVPQSTGSLGFIFNRSGWFGAIADKYVGPYVVYSSAMVNPDLGLYNQTTSGLAGGTAATVLSATNPGYSMLDLSGGYALKMPQGSPIHSLKIKLQIDNALNRKVQDLSSVKATGNAYNVLPTTNYFITFSTEF